MFASYAAAFLEVFGKRVSSAKKRVIREIVACRTAVLGGHLERCDKCGLERPMYDSCRNRHCPKCQGSARAKWLDAKSEDLLPVEYFHVVFTVPPAIAEIALQNKRVMYGILMRASAEAIKKIGADPKHLGAKIGFLSILHTWGQNMHHHPHVHCVVPGGGLSNDGKRWIACRPGFFLPVRILSAVFRGKFLEHVRRAFARGELEFQGSLTDLKHTDRFEAHLEKSLAKDWVVYAKRPFGGSKQVLKYLAGYTHRVAISNHRLVSLDGGKVRFRWKDYAHGSRKRHMTLDAVEFIRRFLLHVLPRGFVRIRSYGLLANRCRVELLVRCRELLGVEESNDSTSPISETATSDKAPPCPSCKTGQMIRAHRLFKVQLHRHASSTPAILDSS